ncbi:MAG TPA: hypothetical protein VHV76_06835 [Mycobacteriales bacterium]|nr:hypothetical protein [Mycobacteriales bacterium]
MLVAALLYAGTGSAIDGVDACRFHGLRAITHDEDFVHVAVPRGATARSTGFVIVRQTGSLIATESTTMLRYVDPATAAISAARRMSRPRAILAALSDVLQRNLATYDELLGAHLDGPPRNSRLAGEALEQLGHGILSVAEADFRKIAAKSKILPPLEFNVWLRLRCGRVLCVDALIQSSAVVHEINGRIAHAREDLFEDMQERHDALTASGLTVLHNAPRRVLRSGDDVIGQLEKCHLVYEGRGMPEGVEVIARAG